MNKEKVIELLHKYGNESEMFKAFVTEDEFENLAEDLVKLLIIPDVSKQRELLIAYEKQMYTPEEWHLSSKQLIETIDLYISNL